MNGVVDRSGRALLDLRIGSTSDSEKINLAVWIDTAFTGELVIPRPTIERLGLVQSSAVAAGLADGTQVVLETYSCAIEWFDGYRMVEAVASDGQFPLLGIGLLQTCKLEVDYRLRTLRIN